MLRGTVSGIMIAGFILLHGFQCDARGESWLLFGKSDNGMHYVNKNIKKVSDTNVRVWVRVVYSEEGIRDIKEFLIDIGKYNGEIISHELTYYEFDCRAAKQMTVGQIIYDIDGNRIAMSPKNITGWVKIVPKGYYDDLYGIACK